MRHDPRDVVCVRHTPSLRSAIASLLGIAHCRPCRDLHAVLAMTVPDRLMPFPRVRRLAMTTWRCKTPGCGVVTTGSVEHVIRDAQRHRRTHTTTYAQEA